ncbi:MAG: anhydro-N-acetylmuramic acid kinase [Zetaproteobacteria bacterium]|nr:anhydro-N-acetylmuramic acid kinase [Zetaproteobacteria bacterium]
MQYDLGIMSGTSMDGIDVAIIDQAMRLHHWHSQPFPTTIHETLQMVVEADQMGVDDLAVLDQQLGECFAQAALAAIAEAKLSTDAIGLIGSHGQTIRHRPPQTSTSQATPFSLQLGCPSIIAERTGITTVADFRRRDIAAGGQGAPLVPFAHQQLFGQNSHDATAILNIGGIANLTYWQHRYAPLMGFDTGPGNMVMDGLMQHISHGTQPFDRSGQLAAKGIVHHPLLNQWMQHPFIQTKPPKSTGREMFGRAIIQTLLETPNINDADRMATALAFTVETIAQSIEHLPEPPKQWIVCGGGAFNDTFMQQLQQRLTPATVQTSNAFAIPPQAIEAICFALLARATLLGHPNTLKEVTGANHHVCGGHIVPGKNWQQWLQKEPLR